MNSEEAKKILASAALNYVEDNIVIGIGTGTTANHFIDALATVKHIIEGAVASSVVSEERLKSHGIPVFELNTVSELPVYIDGADEADPHLHLIKGGGGALTREKIVASSANKFICMVEKRKQVDLLGTFPVAVEVLPMARSYVAREIVKLKADPVYREGFVTDNGNIIIDVHNLEILEPLKLEQALNNITGVVCNGIFAQRPADVLLVAGEQGVETITAR